jgi:hypothetical protein
MGPLSRDFRRPKPGNVCISHPKRQNKKYNFHDPYYWERNVSMFVKEGQVTATLLFIQISDKSNRATGLTENYVVTFPLDAFNQDASFVANKQG